MKRVLLILLVLIVLLLAVVVVVTLLHPFASRAPRSAAIPEKSPVTERSLERFAGGLRIPTVSSVDYEQTDFEPFERFKAYLREVYPAVFEVMETEVINEYGMVFHWKGKGAGAKNILFLAHYDVVPVTGYDMKTIDNTQLVFSPGDPAATAVDGPQTAWDHPPFSGAVANGRIYGRGALDMKCMLFGVLEAADALIAEGYRPEHDIWLAFGQDEEVGGMHGAYVIAQNFKKRGLTFDAVYDEGGIIAAPGSALPQVDSPIALVGLSEKGFLTLEITVRGQGGHASMPPAKSSLVYAAEIIEKLNNNQMPAHIIPPVASFLNNVGGYMGFASRAAIANQWLLKPVLIKSLEKSQASNALVRTTTAITMTKGSDAPNVIANDAVVTVNFRILQGESVQQVIDHVHELCEGYDVSIEAVSSREPSGVSPENARGFEVIREAVGSVYPDALVTAYVTIGGTDAYKYQIVSDHIYRFMPLYLNQYEQSLIHNENEYIGVDNFMKLIAYFRYIMENY